MFKHILSASQFNANDLVELFADAEQLRLEKTKYSNLLQRKIMATLFYEPSTRTRLSFESAMIRLGGAVITSENASEQSSAKKGESIEDTIRVVESYSDIIVLRHDVKGMAEVAARVASVP